MVQDVHRSIIIFNRRGFSSVSIDVTGCASIDCFFFVSTSYDQGLALEVNQNEGQETEKEREEREAREVDQSIDEYAALAMTDEMVNEDDLLDDMAELEEQNRDVEMEDGRIEAISQLSPELAGKEVLKGMKNGV
ncbi:hypothetical protein F2Q70_00026380 [Brassica cretica]|uniref:Uncharacterized protein n=1 Tax=Brassica cretica TaxID=69181 RepID=A0A3N6SJL3_BRACR|nr:hypothetical protein F2Q70_00026380 [Brassica cretica]